MIDDIDIKDIKVHSLRQQIAIVTQEALLFSGTIYENIVQGLNGTRHEHRDRKTKQKWSNVLVAKSMLGVYPCFRLWT